jgi:murein DD-endopeptidase MepM/ murein hydrolase activator NlpD
VDKGLGAVREQAHGPNPARRRRDRPPTSLAGKGPGLIAAASLGAVLASLVPAVAPRPANEPVATSEVATSHGPGANGEGEIDPRHDVALLAAVARVENLRVSRADREAEEAQRRSLPLSGILTTAFAQRWGVMHWGVDIAAPMLTPEYAAAGGTVVRAGPASGYGNVIYIQHPNGDLTVYGHMEKVLVRAGQEVKSGQLIARVGSRGFSTGPHLHFEVWAGGLNGRRVDPLGWLAEQGIRL